MSATNSAAHASYCTCNRVVVPRHRESEVSSSHVEDLDVVVDASAHDLLVVPRQAYSGNLILVHELRHRSPYPRVPQFHETVVRSRCHEITRARYGTAVHHASVPLSTQKQKRVIVLSLCLSSHSASVCMLYVGQHSGALSRLVAFCTVCDWRYGQEMCDIAGTGR